MAWNAILPFMTARNLRPLGRRVARFFAVATTASMLGLAWLPGQALAYGAFRAVPASGFGHAVRLRFPADATPPGAGYLFTDSCARPGDCAAGGNYTGPYPNTEALVITESAGRWARGVALHMPPGAPATIDARVDGVACPRLGTCWAVGSYGKAGSSERRLFAAREVSGHWRQARTLHLPANSAAVPNAGFGALSCTAPGSCAAVGFYMNVAGHFQAFAITERSGRWGKAIAVAPPANAQANSSAFLTAIACPHAGSCVAAGRYLSKAGASTPMGVVQHRGRWPRATPIKQPSDSAGTFTEINSLSCTGTGKCVVVGGYFVATSTLLQPLSASESGGHWTAAKRIRAVPPGAVGATVRGVSCAASGSCVAVGDYANAAGAQVPWSLVRSVSGRWSAATTVVLPSGGLTGTTEFASLTAVSCISGRCTAAGWYHTASGGQSPMAATRR